MCQPLEVGRPGSVLAQAREQAQKRQVLHPPPTPWEPAWALQLPSAWWAVQVPMESVAPPKEKCLAPIFARGEGAPSPARLCVSQPPAAHYSSEAELTLLHAVALASPLTPYHPFSQTWNSVCPGRGCCSPISVLLRLKQAPLSQDTLVPGHHLPALQDKSSLHCFWNQPEQCARLPRPWCPHRPLATCFTICHRLRSWESGVYLLLLCVPALSRHPDQGT